MVVREPRHREGLRHLSRLTDDRGILEHAEGPHPRFHHGYCTDDNARLLVVAARDRGETPESAELARIAARFLLDAQRFDGRFHNRLSFERIWQDVPTAEDCWGRALWGFGTATALSDDDELRNRCYEGFGIGCLARPESIRSMCFAVLGAARIMEVDDSHEGARFLLESAAAMLDFHPDGRRADWPWPEPRLTYANALIPEAMVECGTAIGRDDLVERGISLLAWLVRTESHGDHLSVTPAGGRGPGDPKPAFDQQPIEVAAIADAAVTALHATGDDAWHGVVERSVNWFLGNNDSGRAMIDVDSGGGYDGLESDGVNVNQGAESTLAMISTMQHARTMWLV